MKSMLVIGGTGIIGKPLVEQALRDGYYVSVIAKGGRRDLPREAHYYESDRKNSALFHTILKDMSQNFRWDVVADVTPYAKDDSEVLVDALGSPDTHFFVMSTTLVYDRSKISFRPISEEHPFASLGTQGKYVDDKIALESFWQETGLNWTALRPYHVLGKGSFLGCTPPHNRDPDLPRKIANGEKIQLCDGGRIPLNVVFPSDLGQIVVKAAQNPTTFRQAYNAVNPTEVLARDYFSMLARQMGTRLNYEPVASEQFWENPQGWSLTLLPHLYDTSKLERDVGYVPSTSLDTCLRTALDAHPRLLQSFDRNSGINPSELPVHKNMNKEPFPWTHKDYTNSFTDED